MLESPANLFRSMEPGQPLTISESPLMQPSLQGISYPCIWESPLRREGGGLKCDQLLELSEGLTLDNILPKTSPSGGCGCRKSNLPINSSSRLLLTESQEMEMGCGREMREIFLWTSWHFCSYWWEKEFQTRSFHFPSTRSPWCPRTRQEVNKLSFVFHFLICLGTGCSVSLL